MSKYIPQNMPEMIDKIGWLGISQFYFEQDKVNPQDVYEATISGFDLLIVKTKNPNKLKWLFMAYKLFNEAWVYVGVRNMGGKMFQNLDHCLLITKKNLPFEDYFDERGLQKREFWGNELIDPEDASKYPSMEYIENLVKTKSWSMPEEFKKWINNN